MITVENQTAVQCSAVHHVSRRVAPSSHQHGGRSLYQSWSTELGQCVFFGTVLFILMLKVTLTELNTESTPADSSHDGRQVQ